jgi:hypothetical protein
MLLLCYVHALYLSNRSVDERHSFALDIATPLLARNTAVSQVFWPSDVFAVHNAVQPYQQACGEGHEEGGEGKESAKSSARPSISSKSAHIRTQSSETFPASRKWGTGRIDYTGSTARSRTNTRTLCSHSAPKLARMQWCKVARRRGDRSPGSARVWRGRRGRCGRVAAAPNLGGRASDRSARRINLHTTQLHVLQRHTARRPQYNMLIRHSIGALATLRAFLI